jgi:two-component system, OmpR family, response regulator VicR
MTRILFVDDDSFLASIYGDHFASQGYEVLFAGNGEDGVRLAEQHQPDVIVLDLVMPRMDGFTALERLKGVDVTARIPVIVHSSLGQRSDIDRCLGLGAKDYVMKAHSSPEGLLGRIRALLHH